MYVYASGIEATHNTWSMYVDEEVFNMFVEACLKSGIGTSMPNSGLTLVPKEMVPQKYLDVLKPVRKSIVYRVERERSDRVVFDNSMMVYVE